MDPIEAVAEYPIRHTVHRGAKHLLLADLLAEVLRQRTGLNNLGGLLGRSSTGYFRRRMLLCLLAHRERTTTTKLPINRFLNKGYVADEAINRVVYRS